MPRRALITGRKGQDGSYLADLLEAEGMEVIGLDLPEADLGDAEAVRRIVTETKPDEVYNFGGITDLKTAYADPERTRRINYAAVGVLLDAALAANPSVRFLQASSSEIFVPSAEPLDESSPRDWQSTNPYARAKMEADRDFVQAAREKGAFACSAILFNHESPRRSERSALRKICRTLVRMKLGQADVLPIGNVDMSRDWGYAGDYVAAMRAMLRMEKPQDLVIATGELHTVREAIDIAARELGIEPRLEVMPELFRPAEAHPKVGNAAKARQVLQWAPTIGFEALIRNMVRADLAALSRPIDGAKTHSLS